MLICLDLWSVTQQVQQVRFPHILILFPGPQPQSTFPIRFGVWLFSFKIAPFCANFCWQLPFWNALTSTVFLRICMRNAFVNDITLYLNWVYTPGTPVQKVMVGLVNAIFNENWCDMLPRSKCRELLFVTASHYSTFWRGTQQWNK